MINKTEFYWRMYKDHYCPYCKDFSIYRFKSNVKESDDWLVCRKCERSWPVPKEDQDEHSSDNP